MLGVVKTARGEGNVEVRDVPEPQPGPGEVKIAVKNAGICGTDLHIYHDEFMSNPPVVMGHEFCGVIAEVGEGVTAYAPGDRVTCETAAKTCGRCRYCRRGDYNLCKERLGFGYGVNGAFTNYVIAREQLLHRLPDNVDFVAGALTEPLACAVHGVIHLTQVQAGDIVAVTGPGPIGLMVAQVAKAEGGHVVLMGTNRDAARLGVAQNLGLAKVINIEEEDASATIAEMTDGFGADVVFESAGTPPAARMLLNLVRKAGKFTQVGLMGKPFEIDWEKIAYKEIQVTGMFSQNWRDWERALALLSQGKVDARAVVSNQVPITDWKESFDKLEAAQEVKVLLQPVNA
jgi:L-iditol 2-dehydrogenase